MDAAQAPRIALHALPSQTPTLASVIRNRSEPVVYAAGSDFDTFRLGKSSSSLRIVRDFGVWRLAEATVERPLALSATGAVDHADIQRAIRRALATGADECLTPGLMVPSGRFDILEAVVTATIPLVGPQTVAHLTLAPSWLNSDEQTAEYFDEQLERLPHGIALTVVGDPKTVSTHGRIENVRNLVSKAKVSRVISTDYPLALDLLAHGADEVTVGANSGLRVPGKPDSKPQRSEDGFPAIFFRPLLQARSATALRTWFTGTGVELSCPRCGSLVIFENGSAQKRRTEYHNAHSVFDLDAEFGDVPAELRASWAAEQRLRAVEVRKTEEAVRGASPALIGLLRLDGVGLEQFIPAMSKPD